MYLAIITAFDALIAASTQTFPPVITKYWHKEHAAIFSSYCA